MQIVAINETHTMSDLPGDILDPSPPRDVDGEMYCISKTWLKAKNI